VGDTEERPEEMKTHIMKCIYTALFVVLFLGITSSFSKDNNLKCSPFKLKSGDTLTISMTVPHEKELAIVDPDGAYFLLSYDSKIKILNSSQFSIYNFDHFDTVKTIKLDVSTAEGSPYTAGKKNNEKIFVKPGRYKILLSSDLHSEDVLVYERNVEFIK
jgi:hypothetical protein